MHGSRSWTLTDCKLLCHGLRWIYGILHFGHQVRSHFIVRWIISCRGWGLFASLTFSLFKHDDSYNVHMSVIFLTWKSHLKTVGWRQHKHRLMEVQRTQALKSRYRFWNKLHHTDFLLSDVDTLAETGLENNGAPHMVIYEDFGARGSNPPPHMVSRGGRGKQN